MEYSFSSQSVKTTEVCEEKRGFDGGKLVTGRKRHIVVDTLGLLMLVTFDSTPCQKRTRTRSASLPGVYG